MTQPLESLLRSTRLLRASRPNAPDVGFCQWRGQPAFIKSYHHCPPWYRQTVGRLALNREWLALERLAGSGRSPEPFERPLPWVVITQWVEGTPLEAVAPGQVAPERLLGEGQTLLGTLHAAGVVHGDLGHDYWSVQGRESNLILTRGLRLVALDFAGSWTLDGSWQRMARALQRHDELLLTKLLYHWGDDSLADHPAWRLPSERSVAWWNLMRLLGKV